MLRLNIVEVYVQPNLLLITCVVCCRNICTEAVHPLHREDACQLLAANEAAAAAAAGAATGAATRAAAVAAAAAACAANFCGLCCKHNTALLGYYQTQMCLQQCKKNEVLAAALSIHLSRLLQECTHIKGEGFNHSNEVKRIYIYIYIYIY